MNDQTLSAKKEKAVADYIVQMVCIDCGSDRTLVGFISTYWNNVYYYLRGRRGRGRDCNQSTRRKPSRLSSVIDYVVSNTSGQGPESNSQHPISDGHWLDWPIAILLFDHVDSYLSNNLSSM